MAGRNIHIWTLNLLGAAFWLVIIIVIIAWTVLYSSSFNIPIHRSDNHIIALSLTDRICKMDIPKSMNRSRSPPPTSRFLKIGISPHIGTIKHTTEKAGISRQTTFQSHRDSDLATARETYRREKLAEREKRKIQSTSDLERSKALDTKQCVLEAQKLCLKDLAAEENHVKEFARIPGASTVDLEKSHKEVERVITVLHRRQQGPGPRSDGF